MTRSHDDAYGTDHRPKFAAVFQLLRGTSDTRLLEEWVESYECCFQRGFSKGTSSEYGAGERAVMVKRCSTSGLRDHYPYAVPSNGSKVTNSDSFAVDIPRVDGC